MCQPRPDSACDLTSHPQPSHSSTLSVHNHPPPTTVLFILNTPCCNMLFQQQAIEFASTRKAGQTLWTVRGSQNNVYCFIMQQFAHKFWNPQLVFRQINYTFSTFMQQQGVYKRSKPLWCSNTTKFYLQVKSNEHFLTRYDF